MERLDGPNSVKVISVIEVKAKRGFGIKGDPVREITQYWGTDGNFLAERDDEPQMLCEQTQWESERLKTIVEDYVKNRKLQ